ncbi:MAG TPA: BMP family ABC transporter substrate-binding protein [Actinomycetota bacterium]|nr:BMP family ABC transporter substrate-binding protein [Actinomycetota bacterium]
MKRWLRVLAIVAVLAMLAAACGDDDDDGEPTGPAATGETATGPTGETAEPLPGEDVTVGLVYDIGGRGDLSFNDSAAAGLDQGVAELGIQTEELEPDEGGTNRAELLSLLASEGSDLVIGVGFLFAETICQAGIDFPDVNFGDVDGFIDENTPNCEGAHNLTAEDNIASLLFAEEQGSFLVGAAAALKSETGHVGFIGGVDIDLIHKFQAGFEAGAREINPEVEIDVTYISQPPDFSGFNDPARAKEIAASMYEGGADVVYHAAGGSGLGMFQAAQEYTASSGTHVWGIGVDSDQYQTLPEELQPHVLTSMLKRVDVAVFETIRAQVEGAFEGGYHTFDLSVDGVGYSTSGGFVDDIADQLEDLKAQIIDGSITVPTS